MSDQAHTFLNDIFVTYRFVKVIRSELYRTIWHDADAICPISRHHAPEAFLAPDLLQCLPNAHLILVVPTALHLQQDLQPLKWTYDRAAHCSRHATRDEGCHHHLTYPCSYCV